MTKIKFCGLTCPADIQAVNELLPDYVGFVFAPKSKRYVSPERAADLKRQLDPRIRAVGVFVNEPAERVAELLHGGVIDMAQLHGTEDEACIRALRERTEKPILQAFRIPAAGQSLSGTGDEAASLTAAVLARALSSPADCLLLDAGAGEGSSFDWSLITQLKRPYVLAGGLTPENVAMAVRTLHPYGVDVSSGIETDGHKDKSKMAAFLAAVRKEERT